MTRKTDWREWDAERDRLLDGVPQELIDHARAQMEAEITGYELAQLRKELGVTQTQLAQHMGVSQARVSEIERGNLAHTELNTVRNYIEALGGRVRVIADMGSRSVDIRGLDDPTAA